MGVTSFLGTGLHEVIGIHHGSGHTTCDECDLFLGQSFSAAEQANGCVAAARHETCEIGSCCPICQYLAEHTFAGQQTTDLSIAICVTERGLATPLLLPAPEFRPFEVRGPPVS